MATFSASGQIEVPRSSRSAGLGQVGLGLKRQARSTYDGSLHLTAIGSSLRPDMERNADVQLTASTRPGFNSMASSKTHVPAPDSIRVG